MKSKEIKKNSWQAWILATRPQTLAAGSVPVITASALAYAHHSLRPLAALLCLLFALLAQIASNFSNDYFDFKKKTDNENRLGPSRAVASGWIAPKLMLLGTMIVIGLACGFGLGLVYYGGWSMILIGVVCVVALLAYSAGPFPLSYNGLGDVFVLVFFGWTAVDVSFYLQTGYFHTDAFVAGTAVGLGAVNILILNNFRDYDNDKQCGKHTSIVLLGQGFGKWMYLTNGIMMCILCFWFIHKNWIAAALLPLLFLPFHIYTWRLMCTLKGRELNRILGLTARNLVIFGILFFIGLIW